MMHKYIFTIFLSTLFLVACNSDTVEGFLPEKPVEGFVVARLGYEVELDTAFQFFNSLNLEMEKITGYEFGCGFSGDSADYIYSVLTTKEYLNYGKGIHIWVRWNEDQVTSSLRATDVTFHHFTAENLADWVSTKELLTLNEFASHSHLFILKIPADTQTNWESVLTNNRYVAECLPAYEFYFND
jgi:hypothetical protein